MDTESATGLTTGESSQTTAPSHAPDVRIRLQVGERLFTTTRQTLVTESAYFATPLSGRWKASLEDGSYFVDADPALFEHVLGYIRHSVCPVLYEETRGHDHGLYLALLGEARYFGIPRLEKWLEEKRYVEAVRATRTLKTYRGDEVFPLSYDDSPTDTTLEFYPWWGLRETFVCPRGLAAHKDRPSACGRCRQCRNAQGDDVGIYEDEIVPRMFVVEKTVCVLPEVCISYDHEA